jgi:thiol-disulfide isomerase/thioredoxin
MIAPVYEKMAEEFPGVVFTKIDVDANSEAAEQCGVQACRLSSSTKVDKRSMK